MTDREVQILQSGLNLQRSLRAIRSRIMLQAWQDPGYKAQLLADPIAVLVAEGFQIAAATVTILENDAEHLHLVIPTLDEKYIFRSTKVRSLVRVMYRCLSRSIGNIPRRIAIVTAKSIEAANTTRANNFGVAIDISIGRACVASAMNSRGTLDYNRVQLSLKLNS